MDTLKPTPTQETLIAPASLAGLSSEQAKERLAEFGPNDPTPVRHGALALELLTLFLNPLVVILLVASLISAFLGQPVDAAIIFVVVLLGATINFIQTYRSQKAIERLREYVSLTATVLRDGVWQEVKRHEVVVGDLVRLSAGDLVPADAKLLESRDLYVQQGRPYRGIYACGKGRRVFGQNHTRDAAGPGDGLPGNIGRQRNRDCPRHRHWTSYSLRRDRGKARAPAPGDRIRTWVAPLRHAHPSLRVLPGPVHSGRARSVA